jgi:predicted dienelactone hydrolase
MKFKLGGHRSKPHTKGMGFSPPASPLSLLPLLSSLTLALGWGTTIPAALAAERVTLRLGPFEQAIAISDLEQFAKTGELSGELQLYASVLTSQVREVLNRRLQIDPNIADKLIEDVLRSPGGNQLIQSLGVAIPNSSVEQIQAAVSLAARQANGLSLVGFLRAYPQENITLDATNAIALALQFNPSYWQSQALGPLLERELAVNNNTPFKPAFDPALPGSQTVQQQTLFLQDRQRHRTVPVDIYFPKQEEKRTSSSPLVSRLLSASQPLDSRQPLVIISHGFGANRKSFAYLARHLASHGLTVAALEHPGSNIRRRLSVSVGSNPSELLPATEFIDRPKDVSFVLDELAKLNQQPGPLQEKLNTQQVSVIGHSLGGYTALALAGAEVNLVELRQFCTSSTPIGQAPADWIQCAAANLSERKLQLRDQRIKSAIALNPVVGNIFGKTGLTQVATPVLFLAGTEDTITPALNHQLRPFAQLRGPKYLLTAIGGTHLSIGDPVNPGSMPSQSTLVKERRGEETNSLRQLTQGVSLAFIKQLTPEAKTYEPFLTPAYAQSFSKPELPLRLNTQLPASIAPWIELVVKP